jgi:hypothetical protein
VPFRVVFDPFAQNCAKQQLWGCIANSMECFQKKFHVKGPNGSKVMSKKLNIPFIFFLKKIFIPSYMLKEYDSQWPFTFYVEGIIEFIISLFQF